MLPVSRCGVAVVEKIRRLVIAFSRPLSFFLFVTEVAPRVVVQKMFDSLPGPRSSTRKSVELMASTSAATLLASVR